MSMTIIKDLLLTIILMVVVFSILISMYIPKIAGWKAGVSCVDGVDYGWLVDLITLTVFLTPVGIAIGLLWKTFKSFSGK